MELYFVTFIHSCLVFTVNFWIKKGVIIGTAYRLKNDRFLGVRVDYFQVIDYRVYAHNDHYVKL